MKKPTAEALKEAREQRTAVKAAADKIAEKLGTPDWNEAVDGPALETEKRNLEAAILLVDRFADQLAIESRSTGWNGDNQDTPGVSVNVITNRTKDADLPKQFRLIRALRAKHGIKDVHGKIDKMDGIEAEMIQEGEREARAAEISDINPDGIMVPAMCSYARTNPNTERERRDMVVGTNASGGFSVATDLGDMIGFLDPNTPLVGLGARLLTGLVGNLAIPRQSARATGYAVAEQGTITESGQTLQQLSLSPKRQGAYVEFSLQLLRQSTVDIENWLRSDLRNVLMQLQEQYAIQGTGSSNQPTGITATSGIGSVAGGTNGLIPTWDNIVSLETAVATANALKGKLGYLTTPGIVGKLKQVKRDVAGNGFIWEGMSGAGGIVNGYNARTSTLVPSTLTKGTASGICHAILFGNFEELLLAYWGGVEVILDPYSLATTGSYRITANTFMDVGVRHAASFAAMLDALAA